MLAELGLLLLLAADGRGIAVVPGGAPDEGCPSARQVTDALAARLPGLVVPAGSTSAPGTLRLSVNADPGGGLRVDIADSGGAAVLRRVLPAAPRARTSDCAVLGSQLTSPEGAAIKPGGAEEAVPKVEIPTVERKKRTTPREGPKDSRSGSSRPPP